MFELDLTYLVVVFGSILLSMTLHEAMHAYVSYWLGDDTARLHGRLTLNPLAHIDPITTVILPLSLAAIGAPPFGAAKPVPFNPNRLRFGEYGAALVGAAGPLTNFALALVAGTILRLFGPGLDSFLALVLSVFTLVNLAFFVFNMIPFPPLDGSRVLYVFAPEVVRRVMENIESMGIMAIMLFFGIFYLFLGEIFATVLNFLFGLVVGSSVVL